MPDRAIRHPHRCKTLATQARTAAGLVTARLHLPLSVIDSSFGVMTCSCSFEYFLMPSFFQTYLFVVTPHREEANYN